MSTRTATTPVTSPAAFKPPPNACDCHAHVYGPYDRFPLDADRIFDPVESTIEDYMRKQDILGFDRGILTQPSHYGVDNRCMLDALGKTKGKVKGLVNLDIDDITDRKIAELSAIGIVGVRLNDRPAGPMIADVAAVANRLKGSDWHVEIMPSGPLEQLIALRPAIEKLPVPVLFEQMGHPDVSFGVGGKLFQELLAMVRNGEVWVKLGHPYMAGDYPYEGSIPFARALAEANPKRCVFGIDWPHPSQQRKPPVDDDGFLLDLFQKWVPDPAMQRTILVESPAELYRF